MKITCAVEETTMENDHGRAIDGVTATCARCDHTTEAYGTGEASIKRCLAMLRDECPRDENNFYVDGDAA